MLLTYRGIPADDTIEVVALSEHEWRLRDQTAAENDALSVLAYVEKDDEGYSVLDLVELPGSWARFDCLASVIATISEHKLAHRAED